MKVLSCGSFFSFGCREERGRKKSRMTVLSWAVRGKIDRQKKKGESNTCRMKLVAEFLH